MFVLLMGFTAVPAAGQEIRYELIDAGILNHVIHGQGIEMRIKPNSMPQGGLEGRIVKEAMPRICKHYAPAVIPFVMDQAALTDPDFIAVRIVTGNSGFGRYVLEVYALEKSTCGNKME